MTPHHPITSRVATIIDVYAARFEVPVMKNLIRTVLFLTLVFVFTPPVLAKGVTVKITVSNAGLEAHLAITDPGVVGKFSIWTGPNSRWRTKGGEWQTDYSGAFVDFPAGTVESTPEDLLRFDVEFFVAAMPEQSPIEETYKMRYAMEPSRAGGYVYLPSGNPFIYHGVEGHWFHSTQAWENLVRPLIQQALGTDQ